MLRIYRVPISSIEDVEFAPSTLHELGLEITEHEQLVASGHHVDTNPSKTESKNGRGIESMAMYIGSTIFTNTHGTLEDRTYVTVEIASQLFMHSFPDVDEGLYGYYINGVSLQIPVDIEGEELHVLDNSLGI